MTRRILILSAHEGHMDRRIVAEANTLVRSGRDVTLVSVPAETDGTALDERVRVIMAPGGRRPEESALKRFARRLPGPLLSAAKAAWYRFGGGPEADFQAYFAAHIPDETFDAIHCHDLTTLPAGLAHRKRRGEGKVIYDAHELYPHQFQGTMKGYWLRIESRTIASADLVVTINQSIANQLAGDYHIDRPAVIYNSYGVDAPTRTVTREEFLSHFGAAPRGPAILFQGQLSEERNLPALVRGFAQMHTPATLLFLGEGPQRDALESLVRREGIAHVHFAPFVRQDRLIDFVARADLGVIPYVDNGMLNSRFCTPNKLFEFIEARVPICSSDLPELRRIVAEGGIGATYPMDTPARIAAALDNCLDRLERGEFTRDRLEAAREAFAWSRQGRKLLGLYDQLGV